MRPVGSGTVLAVAALSFVAFSCLLTSCSGRSGADDAPEPAQALPLQPDAGTVLPVLDALAQPGKAAQYAGQGYFQVPILEQGVLLHASAGVSAEADGVHFSASDNSAWAIFGIHGFDDDSFPGEVDSEASVVSGDYSLGASRFESGRWEFGGPYTQSAKFSLPDSAAHSDPRLYTSPRSYFYVAVVASPGSQLILSGLQLGVDGGRDAPDSFVYLNAYSGDAGIQLFWDNPEGSENPDFAGFAVERALWPGTEFVEIQGLMPETHYLDTNALINSHYRYRLRQEDFSGNASHSVSISLVHTSGDLPPVPQIDFPGGPLYGAQTVTFDMSGSFDPDGDAITEYNLSFDLPPRSGGVPPYTGTNSSTSILMQPGCYIGRYIITANGKQSVNRFYLKVYPQWQADAILVDAADTQDWRMQDSHSIYYPAMDALATCFRDPLVPGVGLLLQLRDGSRELYQLPAPNISVDYISEPVIWNGMLAFAVLDAQYGFIAAFDGQTFQWLDKLLGQITTDMCDPVVDGNGDLQLCYMDEFDPGLWQLIAEQVGNSKSKLTIMPLASRQGPIDVEWNAQALEYDMVYADNAGTFINRYQPGTGILDVQLIGAALPERIDLEIDQASGTPGMLLRLTGVSYYTQYDIATKQLLSPEEISPELLTMQAMDLAIVDTDPTVFLGSMLAPSGLYRRNGGFWNRTEANWASLSGRHSSMAAWPDGSLRIVDGDLNFLTHLVDIRPDNSINDQGSVPGCEVQGRDLNAVAGSDGLHAYWIGTGQDLHYVDHEDGSGWNRAADAGNSEAIEIMADATGQIYLTASSGTTSVLVQWNGNSWDLLTFRDIINNTRPWLCMQSRAPGVNWWSQDSTVFPSKMNYHFNNDGNGLQLASSTLNSIAIQEGAALWNGNFAPSIVILGNSGSSILRLGFLDQSRKEVSHVLDYTYTATPGSIVQGRQLDAVMGKDSRFGSVQEVYWVAIGSGQNNATRILARSDNVNTDILQLSTFTSIRGSGWAGFQQTVSAAEAWGITEVGLVDQFSGPYAELDWDDYGEFEMLPLPPIDFANTNMHEQVVGNDGRWHILYRDMRDGGIYVISTS